MVEDPPVYLDPNDVCYYAREFVSGGGYSASEANSLISNFKKPSSTRGTPQWKYKGRAARQFAREISDVLPQDISIAFLPTSKRLDDEDYDPRFEMTAAELQRFRPDVRIEVPITKDVSTEPAHFGTTKRKILDVYRSLEWVGFEEVPERLILVDDVITCGTNFKACQQLIREHHPEVRVYGLFWARTIWPDQSE